MPGLAQGQDRLWVIPGLFPFLPDEQIPTLLNLERLWGQGTRQRWEFLTLAQWPPAAPRQPGARQDARSKGIEARHRHWLRADPIHLQFEGSGLVLLDRHLFGLDEAESGALIESLNRHFAPDGLGFYALDPTQWLVGFDSLALIETTPPLERVGRSIDGHLPHGEGGRLWCARFNEAQMCLHDHPVNLSRTQRGERAIHGVWFWDEARAPHDHPVLEGLRAPSAYGDAQGWREAVLRLDEAVIGPAIDELRRGESQSLTVVALEGRYCGQAVLRRRDVWRFWRPCRNLSRVPGVAPLGHR